MASHIEFIYINYHYYSTRTYQYIKKACWGLSAVVSEKRECARSEG